MRFLDFGHRALIACAAAAMLQGCGGPQPPIGVSGAASQTSALTGRADRGTSWMLPEAASESLLYVLDQHEVTVYKYPQGKLVGKLKNKNLYLADGACVDMKGDVYVANYGTDQLFEYRHGGKDLVRTIRPPVGSTGCTVDPATGNLAVAGNSGLVVYKRARGEPTVYTNSAFEAYYYCGYDDQGNLFVDGYNQPGSGHTFLPSYLKAEARSSRSALIR